jgi:WD40 repeat protein
MACHQNSDDTVKLWALISGKQTGFLKDTYYTEDVDCSPDSKWLITTYTPDIPAPNVNYGK